MSYITTVTGKHFDPIQFLKQQVDIIDIAHALSLLCRGNGHVRFFYSVAQHCIACAEEAITRDCPWEVVLGCLLHDASEAYLSDVTRPVKQKLPQYLQAEENLQNAIWEHFIGRELTADEKRQILEIDDLMLSMEFHQLMPEELNEDYRKLHGRVVCRLQTPQEVEERFIRMLQYDIPIERLRKDEAWLIDILPGQMPDAQMDRNAAIANEYAQESVREPLYEQFADVLQAISEHYETVLQVLPENSFTHHPSRHMLTDIVQKHWGTGTLRLFLPAENSLFVLNGDDLCIAVYRPTKEQLSVLRPILSEKGLFIRQPQQIERITKYEKLMNQIRTMLDAPVHTEEEAACLRGMVKELEHYYTGEEWKQDFADDEAGLLPHNLKRGVLSEDGVYNLLTEYQEG